MECVPLPVEPLATPGEYVHETVTVALNQTGGLRLPTSDEWEWAYSGGTRQLFPWGGMDDAAPWIGNKSLVNTWGLTLTQAATNFYYFELVDEADVLRGGDGGCSQCGGFGGPASRLPEACAWEWKSSADAYEMMFFRRVLEVPAIVM